MALCKREHDQGTLWVPNASAADLTRSASKDAVLSNRRRIQDRWNRDLQRWRIERADRSFAPTYGLGRQRCVIQAAATNLGNLMRLLFGVGSARALMGHRAQGSLLFLRTGWVGPIPAAGGSSWSDSDVQSCGARSSVQHA